MAIKIVKFSELTKGLEESLEQEKIMMTNTVNNILRYCWELIYSCGLEGFEKQMQNALDTARNICEMYELDEDKIDDMLYLVNYEAIERGLKVKFI